LLPEEISDYMEYVVIKVAKWKYLFKRVTFWTLLKYIKNKKLLKINKKYLWRIMVR
jgi:hypothetical protein